MTTVDAEEDKVDDPWRGTALAGLIALGSQERPSLKGLEKMPSSTRAAQGFSKAEAARPRKVSAIDLLTRPPEQRSVSHQHAEAINEWGSPTAVLKMRTTPLAGLGTARPSQEPQRTIKRQAITDAFWVSGHQLQRESPSTSAIRDRPKPVFAATTRPLSKAPSLLKRKKVKEENKDDRLAEVPMFLI